MDPLLPEQPLKNPLQPVPATPLPARAMFPEDDWLAWCQSFDSVWTALDAATPESHAAELVVRVAPAQWDLLQRLVERWLTGHPAVMHLALRTDEQVPAGRCLIDSAAAAGGPAAQTVLLSAAVPAIGRALDAWWVRWQYGGAG